MKEREMVIGKTWAGVGFVSDLPKLGYVKPLSFLGLPLLITRSKDGQIHVFHNVCSHRGRILVEEEGEAGSLLRCPYHSWSYDLSGNLRSTPHIGGVNSHSVDGFDCADHGLKQVEHAVWMDVIFVNLSGDAQAFEDYIVPLAERWKIFLGDNGLIHLRSSQAQSKLTVEIQSNWKLAVENYCESYHLPFIHPDLNRYSRLEDHYHIMIEDRFGGQGSWAYNLSDDAGVNLPRFPEWPENKLKEAEYISFYPNVLLGLQADHVFVVIIEPKSESRSIEHLRVYYVGDEALGDVYEGCRESVLESWRVVFQEDVGAVEGMQQGRQSPGYGGGVFSPVMDNPTHHFHQWVANKLKVA
ncbi:MAG: Rieske 2Fe-2S domain-containing protein [Gammaproteobacteria bacterium]|nr:Rieske 2Fe-2S domain-containing protein [Gammaproteobacteria bacterium]